MCLCALSLGRLQFSGKPEIGIARFRFPLSVYFNKSQDYKICSFLELSVLLIIVGSN